MEFINVYIELNTLSLNRTFTYACDESVSKGCRVRVSFNHKEYIGLVMETHVDAPSFEVKDVIEVIDATPLLNDELFELAEYMSHRFVSSKMSCFKTMLPPALRPSSHFSSIVYEDWIVGIRSDATHTQRQKEVLRQIQEQLPIKVSQARKFSTSIVKDFLQKDMLIIEQRFKNSASFPKLTKDVIPVCTKEQSQAIEQIEKSDSSIFLLHGVTGSGKTEVFLQLAQKVLDQGKQVLFLVPEIGLTPMMIQRVQARFQKEIAIYHSGLNAQEKYAQYCLVRDDNISIVVGTRSSVFLPFKNLGLILMDEEHDTSYKQDSMPRYHTRDIVLFRARYHQCKVVLSSATPSLESYARAYKGLYELIELKHRIYQQMPQIHLIDMKEEKSTQGLSYALLRGIEDRLQRKEQVILILNRRGYLPVVRCMDCNTVLTCPDCDLALVFHKGEQNLQCHCCGRIFPFMDTCPSCHGHHFYQLGMGTEKLQEILFQHFPQAHIVRMDADSTRKKNAHEKLLQEFEQEGDILLGTQMVSKGLDFENVTLVGILQADSLLVRSAYRSSEIAYEMLEQASGRSGRGKKSGEVMIQTFDPNHYVMQSVISHQYTSFFQKEMQYRHLGSYPPYLYLCSLIFIHSDFQTAWKEALWAIDQLHMFKVLGPVQIHMRQKKQRVRILVKSKDEEQLIQEIWKVVLLQKKRKGVVSLDVNMYPLITED